MGFSMGITKREKAEKGAQMYPYEVHFEGSMLFESEESARKFMRALDEITD